jgi:hypothetical protein
MCNRRIIKTNLPAYCAGFLAMVLALLFSSHGIAQSAEDTRKLQSLTDERIMLTTELDQFRETLAMLHTDGTPPEQSANPAVRTLAEKAANLKQRLIVVTEQEVTLLQHQITAAKAKDRENGKATGSAATVASLDAKPANAMESKPLRTVDYTVESETDSVVRLHSMLQSYYTEQQESANILPTQDELALRQAAQHDADARDRIPFSVDKVQLNGSEGSTALAEISERLMDPRVPESRRDIAQICIIRTRLFNTLVGSENRSLKPVGKNHYIARVRLQPGDTTINIQSDQWEIRLPQHEDARDYLITLYRPVQGSPELHVFAVDDLLAADKPYIPAWLPSELKIKTKAG